MDILDINDFSFKYNNSKDLTLSNINLSISEGDFILLCGPSGSGKTTLLRHIKKDIAPAGKASGRIDYKKENSSIAYIFQNPETQIVMDNVFDELIFSCEHAGLSTDRIDVKLSEITAFFGIEKLLKRKCHTLSGGEKQLVNLASVMMMDPDIIILDEPLSQLDPVGVNEFINVLTRINEELGITVILSEHNMDQIISNIKKVIYIKDGSITYNGSSDDFIDYILLNDLDFSYSLPTLSSLISSIKKNYTDSLENPNIALPKNVKECRDFFLNNQKLINIISKYRAIDSSNPLSFENAITLKNGYFRYEKTSDDVLRDINFKIPKSSIFTITGGNGAGKSTLFSVISGYKKLYKGKIIKNGSVSYLPQDQSLSFIKDTFLEDLLYLLKANKINENIIDETIKKYEFFKNISSFFDKNPLDLSGGQMQLCAIFKSLILSPSILLLDEPTKGLDGYHKALLKNMLISLKNEGLTIIIISHDLNFCAEASDYVAMMFDGKLLSINKPEDFFMLNRFYTTNIAKSLYKISDGLITKDAVLEALKRGIENE